MEGDWVRGAAADRGCNRLQTGGATGQGVQVPRHEYDSSEASGQSPVTVWSQSDSQSGHSNDSDARTRRMHGVDLDGEVERGLKRPFKDAAQTPS